MKTHLFIRKLKLALNPYLINGHPPADERHHVKGWENIEVTVEELADVINDGIAYTCQLNDETPPRWPDLPGPYRDGEHFRGCDVLSADIDHGMRIEAALADEFVKQFATLLYTTKRHTAEAHRFRIIFASPRTITDRIQFETALLNLQIRFGGDLGIKDAARVFNGCTGSNPIILGNALDDDALAELLTAPDIEEGYSAPWLGARSVIGEERFDPNVMVHTPEGWISFANLPNRKVRMDCLFHQPDDFSAFTVFSKDGKTKGTHCSRCNRTWWQCDALIPVYDFSAFNKSLKDKPKTTSRYFQKPTIRAGLNLNISPVGTGKTKALEDVLAAYPTVLVISHRRLLCNELSRRLNVVDYQDHPNSRLLEFPRLVVCLDSLRKVAFGKIKYKVVVLDESEQIFKHFLGGTMEGRDPYDMFLLFQEVILSADIVIAQDADLGWITYNTLGKLKQPIHLNINEYKQTEEIEIFRSQCQLVADLMNNLAAGARIFVAANTKRMIEALQAIVERYLPDLPLITITADTKHNPEVLLLTASPKTEVLRYRLILTSPAMGTGIDLTFPDNAREIDIVYGFLDRGSNDHLDFNQQIGRVRHPGSIKVWVTHRTAKYDISEDVIQQDMISGEAFQRARIYKDFRPALNTDDPFIDMATLARVQDIASKNNLYQNFVDLKQNQGHPIKIAPTNASMIIAGEEYLKRGWGRAVKIRRKKLLTAPILSGNDYTSLLTKREQGQPITEIEHNSIERYEMERFYRTPLTQELIDMDDRGHFQEKVILFEAMSYGDNLMAAIKKSPLDPRFTTAGGNKIVMIYDILRKVGLMVNGVVQDDIAVATCDLDSFADYMTKNKAAVENTLELEVRGDVQDKPIKQLNQVLKLVGLRIVPGKQVRVNKKPIRRYHFDETLAKITAIVERRRIADNG